MAVMKAPSGWAAVNLMVAASSDPTGNLPGSMSKELISTTGGNLALSDL